MNGPDPTQPPRTRWEEQVVGERWDFYTARFDQMIAAGEDLEGEARFVDAMLPRGAAVLDAGCGTGRIAAALARMGHRAVGVDKDTGLIDIAQQRYPGVHFVAADLLQLSHALLTANEAPAAFDVIVLPGNVIVYLAPATEAEVLTVLAALLVPGGRIVAGFATDRDYRIDQFDKDTAAAGLTVEHRFATWQLDAFGSGSSWAVSVLRGVGTGADHGPDHSWQPATSWPRSPSRPDTAG